MVLYVCGPAAVLANTSPLQNPFQSRGIALRLGVQGIGTSLNDLSELFLHLRQKEPINISYSGSLQVKITGLPMVCLSGHHTCVEVVAKLQFLKLPVRCFRLEEVVLRPSRNYEHYLQGHGEQATHARKRIGSLNLRLRAFHFHCALQMICVSAMQCN
jgi:hypothetical protein